MFDLGRLYHYEEFSMVNMTIASMNISMGILPSGSLMEMLKGTLKEIQEFAPSASKFIDKILMGKMEFDYNGAMKSIQDLKERLKQVDLECPEALLIYSELETTLRIIEFAEGVHYINASGDTILEEEKSSLMIHLKNLGNSILDIHPNLWIARNRIHGMYESTKKSLGL